MIAKRWKRATIPTSSGRRRHPAATDQPTPFHNLTARLLMSKRLSSIYASTEPDRPQFWALETRPDERLSWFRVRRHRTRRKDRLPGEGPRGRTYPAVRISVLPDLSHNILTRGNTAKAAEAANEVLNSDQDKTSWNYGNTIFAANTVLGRIALQQGDTKKAARRLLAAGRVPSNPQLSSVGPPIGAWRRACSPPVTAIPCWLTSTCCTRSGRTTTPPERLASTIRSGERQTSRAAPNSPRANTSPPRAGVSPQGPPWRGCRAR